MQFGYRISKNLLLCARCIIYNIFTHLALVCAREQNYIYGMLQLKPRIRELLLTRGINIPVDLLIRDGMYTDTVTGCKYILITCQKQLKSVDLKSYNVVIVTNNVTIRHTKNIQILYILQTYQTRCHIFNKMCFNNIVSCDTGTDSSHTIHTSDGSVCINEM